MKRIKYLTLNTIRIFLAKPKFLSVIAIGLLMLSHIWVVPLWGDKSEAPSAETTPLRVLKVATETFEKQPAYQRTRNYLGKVQSKRSSRLGFELAGMLQALHGREGDNVEKGQLLAELDTQRLEAAKTEAEAQLLEAEASVTLAQATLQRTRQAEALKAVSIQKLDEAVSNLDSQQARLVRIKAQIDRIDVDIAKSRLYAPYSGTLAARMSDEGTVLSSGQPILEIIETAKTEIRIGFDRDIAAGLEVGSLLSAEVRERSFPMRIERILPGRERVTRVVQVYATPTDASIDLREGDLVNVSLHETIPEPGYWLPISALTENARGLWSCFVAEELEDPSPTSGPTHQLKRKDIEIISLEQDRVYVRGDLQPGDRFMVDGLHRIVPNQRVQLTEDNLRADSALISNPIPKGTL